MSFDEQINRLRNEQINRLRNEICITAMMRGELDYKITEWEDKITKPDKAKRKTMGYIHFTKAKWAELKQDKSILAGDRLKIIGSSWKNLSKQEKDDWNAKA